MRWNNGPRTTKNVLIWIHSVLKRARDPRSTNKPKVSLGNGRAEERCSLTGMKLIPDDVRTFESTVWG